MDMTEDEERRARERDEIAARVAAFRATQEKFKRERDEYFVSTLENARKVVSAARAARWAEVLGYSPRQFVRLALQDELREAGLPFRVELSVA